jgi:hypothetical protein
MASKTSNIATTTFVVTFSLFMVEGLMHYNFGKRDSDPNSKWSLPPTKTLIKLGATVAVFSLINGLVLKQISK